jgi:hypothetical protein
MTQETDEVTQEQERLDAEQGLQPDTAGQMLTADQVAEIVRAQLRPIESQIRGVQSINDKAADAIRRDLTAEVEQRFGNLQSDMGRQTWLSTLDERERELVTPLLEEMDRRVQPSRPEPVAAQEAGSPDQWAEVYHLVDNAGLQRNDPRIRYDILVNASLTPEQRQTQFLRSIYAPSEPAAPAAAQPTPAQDPAPNATASPPVEGGGGGAAVGAITSQDNAREALIEGRITTDQYRTMAAERGWTV